MLKLLCLMGLHNWHEPEMNFFNPAEVHEKCLTCGARRVRFDKTRKKDAWRRKKWF